MPQPIKKHDIQNQEIDPVKKIEIEDIFEHEDTSKIEQESAPVEVQESIPEVNKEVTQEKKFESEQKKEGEMDQMKPAPTAVPAEPAEETSPVTTQKSVEQVKIENILSEHLDDLFLEMTPQEQMTFKKKGEETAEQVNKLLKETKVKVKEILELIKAWLKIIPGVNKFFIEQEAKIKTDRLLNLRERK